MLADIMILSILWWILCIPVFTIGASTTALFYVTTRRITDRDGYLLRDFFKSFKTNFKLGTLSWLILIAVGLILYVNITQMSNLSINPTMQLFLYPFQVVFLIEVVLNALYIFVIIARFDMKLKEIFKTSVYMVHRHLLTTLMLVILLVGVLLAGDMYPLFYVIAPGCYAYVTSYLFIKIFKKYRPEIDENPYLEIDRQHEEKLRLEREAARVATRDPESIPEILAEKEKDNEEKPKFYV